MVPATSLKKPHRRYTQSSSFKMAVLFTVLLGTAIILLYTLKNQYQQDQFAAYIESTINTQIEIMTAHHEVGGLISLQNQIRDLASRDRDLFYMLIDSEGGLVAGNVNRLPADFTIISEGLLQFTVDSENIVRYGVARPTEAPLTLAAKIHTFDEGYRLVVARNMQALDALETQVKYLGRGMLLLMVLVVVSAFFISAYVVKRINRIAATARNVMDTGDLSQRIPIDNAWDDLGDLSLVLNELLGRVEMLMQGVRDVSDNIAHDLRTPLSRLRNHLEQLTESDTIQEDDALKNCSEKLLDEADQLLATFHALLRISNIEKGKRHAPFETLLLSDVVEDVIELYAPLAEEKDIILTHHTVRGQLFGDKDLLFQALSNLLDNAIKYTPKGGSIALSLEKHKGHFRLSLADSGPGITDADKEKVFQRFYRVDSARTSSNPGNGLGLAMVGAILELHHVAITLEDNHPGLRVVLDFPITVKRKAEARAVATNKRPAA